MKMDIGNRCTPFNVFASFVSYTFCCRTTKASSRFGGDDMDTGGKKEGASSRRIERRSHFYRLIALDVSVSKQSTQLDNEKNRHSLKNSWEGDTGLRLNAVVVEWP
ncbi:hypothetical protein TNIN_12441 [Trichonephila inaurata madagascariensis]|uniref:Uncharacterized protein n=1 Tax=Trichonephila inaurata madagascariensis TaxID=2747483 RepID=A0A8X6X2K5_9ARAC|nr:hypothetical protein TNIN_12441 [Trichonephila inaurata madagascariensis]